MCSSVSTLGHFFWLNTSARQRAFCVRSEYGVILTVNKVLTPPFYTHAHNLNRTQKKATLYRCSL